MTKKDYEMVSRAMKNTRPDCDSPSLAMWGICMAQLAVEFKVNDADFDTFEFVRACNQ